MTYNPRWLDNGVSNDTTMVNDSTTSLVTEYAAKGYTDTFGSDMTPVLQSNYIQNTLLPGTDYFDLKTGDLSLYSNTEMPTNYYYTHPLLNGNFIAFVDDDYIKAQIFTADGTAVGAAVNISTSSDADWFAEVITLPDGKIVCTVADGDDFHGKFIVIDQDLNIIVAETDIPTATSDLADSWPMIVPFADGKFGVVDHSSTTGTPMFGVFEIINGLLTTHTALGIVDINNDDISYMWQMKPTLLANGNAMFGAIDINTEGVGIFIVSRDGTVAKPWTLISALQDDRYFMSPIELVNHNIGIWFYDIDGAHTTAKNVYYSEVDVDGRIVTSDILLLVLPEKANSAEMYLMPDGNINMIMHFQPSSTPGYGYRASYMFNQEIQLLSGPTTLSTDGNGTGNHADISMLSSSAIVMNCQDLPSTDYKFYVYKYDPIGTLQLKYGVEANEISDDGTLVGDSDSAIPTEQAVKTYIDAALTGLSADKIWEGDSSVEVIDDGTATPNISFKVDAIEVAKFTEDYQKLGGPDTFINVDQTSGSVIIYDGSITALSADSDGVSLERGATVNEFSTDGTLTGDSDEAVPTEKAVKTYVDTEITNQEHIIFADNSLVQVVDNGVATGYVEVVADGVQVQYWDSLAATIRMGKAAGAGRITLNDTIVTASIAANDLIALAADTQTFGLATDTYLRAVQSTNTITGVSGTTTVLSMSDTQQVIGVAADTNLDLSQSGIALVMVDGTTVIDANASNTVLILGTTGDTSVKIDWSANTHVFEAAGSEIANFGSVTQTLGVTGDSQLSLNQTADTFTLSAGANTQVTGGLTSLTMGVAGDTTIALDQSIDQIAITAGGQSQILVETSGTTVYDDLTVTGDLFVDGTTFVVNQTHVQTADNLITLNYGEPGAGVTSGIAGVEIDRGSLPNYLFVFAENTDTFRIGEDSTDSTTQAVATREDNPTDLRVPHWNDATKMFITSGTSYITIDDDNSEVIINSGGYDGYYQFENYLGLGDDLLGVGASLYLDWAGGGNDAFAVLMGADSVLQMNINTQTLGLFADTNIKVNQASHWIEFEVSDTKEMTIASNGVTLKSGTNINEFSTDPTLAGDSDNALSTEKAIKAYVDSQIGGSSNWIWQGDSLVRVVDDGTDAGYVEIVADNVEVVNVNATTQMFGTPNVTNINMDQTTDTVSIEANAVTLLEITSTTAALGLTASGILNTDANGVNVSIAATKLLDIQSDIQRIGNATDTNVTVSQSSDEITLMGANAVIATFGVNGLEMASGASITEFSTDGTLNDDSDDAVPTEQAVKTYVDTALANLNADKILEGDSYVEVVDDGTNAGYITIVADGTEVAHFDAQSSTQRIGKETESRMLISDDNVTFQAGAAASLQMTIDTDGFKLATGISVNEISLGAGMGASNTTLVTQGAVKSYTDTGDSTTLSSSNSYTDGEITTLKTYVDVADGTTLVEANAYTDTEITTLKTYVDVADGTTLVEANAYTDIEINDLRNELDLINVRVVSTDTTAVNGDVLLVDSTAGDVNIEMIEHGDARIIIKKKTTDSNQVIISTSPGIIDGKNQVIIDTPYQSFTFVSDDSNFYII